MKTEIQGSINFRRRLQTPASANSITISLNMFCPEKFAPIVLDFIGEVERLI
jgi:hypothetical protein